LMQRVGRGDLTRNQGPVTLAETSSGSCSGRREAIAANRRRRYMASSSMADELKAIQFARKLRSPPSGPEFNQHEIARLRDPCGVLSFDHVDRNHDGAIDLSEFASVCVSRRYRSLRPSGCALATPWPCLLTIRRTTETLVRRCSSKRVRVPRGPRRQGSNASHLSVSNSSAASAGGSLTRRRRRGSPQVRQQPSTKSDTSNSTFDCADSDGDGLLDFNEFATSVESSMVRRRRRRQPSPIQRQLSAKSDASNGTFDRADSDGDGFLEFSEFARAVHGKQAPRQPRAHTPSDGSRGGRAHGDPSRAPSRERRRRRPGSKPACTVSITDEAMAAQQFL
jgi:Ca2+-binding EF-hand superfamily protein